jgi:hypothetical protein
MSYNGFLDLEKTAIKVTKYNNTDTKKGKGYISPTPF